MVSLTKDQLVNVLFGVKGVTFIGAETTTIPDMNKGGREHANYMYDNVVKDSIVHCMLGFDYEARRDTLACKQWVADAIIEAQIAGISNEAIQASVEHLQEHSTQAIEKFEAKERKWGKHMINPTTGKVSRIMLDHIKLDKKTKKELPETYKRYMQVEILGAKPPVYRYKDTGTVLSEQDLATVKSYLKPRTDDDMVIRDYTIEAITGIRINKAHYRIEG